MFYFIFCILNFSFLFCMMFVKIIIVKLTILIPLLMVNPSGACLIISLLFPEGTLQSLFFEDLEFFSYMLNVDNNFLFFSFCACWNYCQDSRHGHIRYIWYIDRNMWVRGLDLFLVSDNKRCGVNCIKWACVSWVSVWSHFCVHQCTGSVEGAWRFGGTDWSFKQDVP